MVCVGLSEDKRRENLSAEGKEMQPETKGNKVLETTGLNLCSARFKTNILKLLPFIERIHDNQESHYSKGLN